LLPFEVLRMGFCEVLRLFLVFRWMCPSPGRTGYTLANWPKHILVFEITCCFDRLPCEFQRTRTRAASAAANSGGILFPPEIRDPFALDLPSIRITFPWLCLIFNPVFVKILECLVLGFLIWVFMPMLRAACMYAYILHLFALDILPSGTPACPSPGEKLV
jgi:hypothetical protein